MREGGEAMSECGKECYTCARLAELLAENCKLQSMLENHAESAPEPRRATEANQTGVCTENGTATAQEPREATENVYRYLVTVRLEKV